MVTDAETESIRIIPHENATATARPCQREETVIFARFTRPKLECKY